ncbi:uncharacterized protein LTR77_005678 [Saxophila tyrrhenica]|uniref:PWWP domain-containing protein n=1 Tax=Saxophila tyrrhenica TaxID=1690608 RepID=A0AAV9PDB3_9PEZI|nr:hypothetical protein LTR77_005678 [Saxophila tyrrhenica]
MAPSKAYGSTWIWPLDGKLWPVVICRDEKVPTEFLEHRAKEYALPAILLGKHKFIWVVVNGLQEVDPSQDYSSGSWYHQQGEWTATDADEQLRCNAFEKDLGFWGDDEFWSNYLLNEAEVRRLEKQGRHSSGKRRWSEDDEHDSSTSGARRIRSRINDAIASSRDRRHEQLDALGDGDLQIPRPSQEKKKKKDNLDDDSSDGEELFVRDRRVDSAQGSVEEQREKYRREVVARKHDYRECTIFVGEEHKPFFLPRDKISHYHYFSKSVQHSPELGNHIKLYENSSIKSPAFAPIHEFLITKDCAPYFLDRKTPQIEGVFSEETKDTAAQIIATIYVDAAKLQLDGLQTLCVRKIKAMHPLSGQSLMLLIRYSEMVYKHEREHDDEYQSRGDLHHWLVDQVAERFFELYKLNSLAMDRILREYRDFRETVVDRLPLYREKREREMGS